MCKRKAEADAVNDAVDICKKFGKVSSGALASGGKYTLCRSTRDLVYQQTLKDIEKRERSERLKISKDNKQTEKYINARNKYIHDPTSILIKEELKVLLKHPKRDNDLKVSDRIGDLRKAWAERQHRLHEDCIPVKRRAPQNTLPDNTSELQTNHAPSANTNTSTSNADDNGPPLLSEFDSLYQSSAVWQPNSGATATSFNNYTCHVSVGSKQSNPPATTVQVNSHHDVITQIGPTTNTSTSTKTADGQIVQCENDAVEALLHIMDDNEFSSVPTTNFYI